MLLQMIKKEMRLEPKVPSAGQRNYTKISLQKRWIWRSIFKTSYFNVEYQAIFGQTLVKVLLLLVLLFLQRDKSF
jgi:hypothetical protein